MESKVTTKRVMALKTAQIKIDPDSGNLTNIVSIECVLEPGDLERLALMFKQRLPIELIFISSQSRMDLDVKMIREETPIDNSKPLDETTLAEGRAQLRASEMASEPIPQAIAEGMAERADEVAPIADPEKLPMRARRRAHQTAE